MRVRTALPFLLLSLWTPSAFAQVSSESSAVSKPFLTGLVRVYTKWRSQTPIQSGCVISNMVATPSAGSSCPSGYWHTRLADPPHSDVCISVLAIILDPEDVPSQRSSLATLPAGASKLCLNGLVRVYTKWRSQIPIQSGCVTSNMVATPSAGSTCPPGHWHTTLADPPYSEVCISVLAIILDPADVPSRQSSPDTPRTHAPSQLFSLATPPVHAPLRLSSLVTPPAHAPSRSSSLATPPNLESRRSLARQKKPWPRICLTSGCNWEMASLQASSVGGAAYMSKSGQANMIQSAQSKRQLVAALEAPFLGPGNPNGYVPYSKIPLEMDKVTNADRSIPVSPADVDFVAKIISRIHNGKYLVTDFKWTLVPTGIPNSSAFPDPQLIFVYT